MKFAETLGRADGVVTQENKGECVQATDDEAWAQALELNPNFDIKMFFFASERTGGYQIFLGPRGTRYPTRGNAEVRILSKCSQVTYARPAQSNQLGDKLLTALIDIHNGKIFGVIGETAIFILGLIIFLLPATGILAHVWRTAASRKKKRAFRG